MPNPPCCALYLGWAMAGMLAARASFAYAAVCFKEVSITDALGVPGAAGHGGWRGTVGGVLRRSWACQHVAGSPCSSPSPHQCPALQYRYPGTQPGETVDKPGTLARARAGCGTRCPWFSGPREDMEPVRVNWREYC